MTFTEIASELSSELRQLNDIIIGALNSSDTPLMDEIVRHFLQAKGKQVRPIMVMLCARLFGDIDDVVLHGAAALELLHNASLIHDDVVDQTSRRRGQDTINAVWDNHIAVLVGDYFVSAALSEAVLTRKLSIITALADLGRELSQGEIHQICNARDHSFRIEDYMRTIDKKTASLFTQCARVGAETKNVPADMAAPLVQYASLLGLCFQIRDDIFDYFNAVRTGKPSGNDLREGKVTLPLLLALQHAPQDEAEKMKQILRHGVPDEEQIRTLTEFTHANGGINAAYEYMEHLHRQALPLLDAYPPTHARECLRSLFTFIISRES